MKRGKQHLEAGHRRLAYSVSNRLHAIVSELIDLLYVGTKGQDCSADGTGHVSQLNCPYGSYSA